MEKTCLKCGIGNGGSAGDWRIALCTPGSERPLQDRAEIRGRPIHAPASWSAVAKRSGDTAFARAKRLRIMSASVRSKAPSSLRFAGGLHRGHRSAMSLPHSAGFSVRENTVGAAANPTFRVLTSGHEHGTLNPIRVGRHVSSAGFPIPTSLASATRVALNLPNA